VIPLTYPATFEKEDLRGKPGEVGIRILEVSRVIAPTLDDELAKQYDFESMDKMRATLRERVGKEKVRQEEARQQEDILTTLIADHPFEVPARLVKQEAEFQLNRVREELKQRNAPQEEIDKQVEALREQADTAAERNVRTFFLIESVARREKIFVTETEVEAELKAIAANHQTTYEEGPSRVRGAESPVSAALLTDRGQGAEIPQGQCEVHR
jgi:trigger factor